MWPLAVYSRASLKPLWVDYRKKQKSVEERAQIKTHFLRFLCDSSLNFHCCFFQKEEEKKTKHIRAKLVPLRVSTFFTFSFDLNFSWVDMLCSSPVTPTVLNSSASNTSRAQPINHWGAWQTNHLLIEWGSHEFLTAFVLFIKPDQTMRIQTSLKGKGGSHRE